MKVKNFKPVKINLGSPEHFLYVLTECGQLMITKVDASGKAEGWNCISEEMLSDD